MVIIVTCVLQGSEVGESPALPRILFSLTNLLLSSLYSFIQSANIYRVPTKLCDVKGNGMVFVPSRPSARRAMGYADKSTESSLLGCGEGVEVCREDCLVEVVFS